MAKFVDFIIKIADPNDEDGRKLLMEFCESRDLVGFFGGGNSLGETYLTHAGKIGQIETIRKDIGLNVWPPPPAY